MTMTRTNLAEGDDGLDVIVGQVLGGVALVLAQDVVGHDHGGKNREALEVFKQLSLR